MLKNIRLHLEKDEEKQKALEVSLAQSILATHHKNINSFTRNIPSLSPLIKHPQLQNYSLFCNKYGEINIVDYGVGRTLYGFHPKQEILQQVDDFNAHAPHFFLQNHQQKRTIVQTNKSAPLNLTTSTGYQTYLTYPTAPQEIDCLVVLGCGLGLHILELMQTKRIRSLIIYEPELQYFQCSILVNKWSEIFDLAKEKGSQIFIQVEKDGRNLLNDIDELAQHENISSFYVYKHYNHPVFDSLLKELNSKSWSELQENGISFIFNDNYNHYVPAWTASVKIEDYRSCSEDSERFKHNLVALEKYFPDIYKEYKDYQPKIWLPVQNNQGQINIVKADSLSPWYSDNPKQDCLYNYENYNEQPHKDGLILGYKGTKLAHYLHYQFVKETEQLLAEAEDEVGALPEDIASIIMFGLGVGYQLEALLKNHHVEKLFLCEPNTDFFYASLFAIDWSTIFEKVEESKGRIYLNIGDDGTHLFRDLLNQFYAIGPYILNNTYFYQSYYNASLNSAIAQLREQLQIVISMGEYFDHARYGIAQTREVIRRGIPILKNTPYKCLTLEEKDVPIFIIGNGPSLDNSLSIIKEHKDTAIIVSCGTALMPLFKAGITPDFHAEIEQNRSTFDWCSRIGDISYLKGITLISCNGIHPDTCDLFKDVLIAFKEGESSTISALTILGQKHFEVLQHAFPTVSNFACDLFSKIGFHNIYLLGVDLGFVDVKYHHSKSSGYYKANGEETYDYAQSNNTSLTIPGNFRASVNTKHEFKISKQIIEQVTTQKKKEQIFFNCSDGAKISGTIALQPTHILLTNTVTSKNKTLSKIYETVFKPAPNFNNFTEQFDSKYSALILKQEISDLQKLASDVDCSIDAFNLLINQQKHLLFDSYSQGHSLLFYLFYGTLNYSNAFLSKIMAACNSSQNIDKLLSEAKSLWNKALLRISDDYFDHPLEFDLSSSFMDLRITNTLQNLKLEHQIETINNFKKDVFKNEYLLFNKNATQNPIRTDKIELVTFMISVKQILQSSILNRTDNKKVVRTFIGTVGEGNPLPQIETINPKFGAVSFYWYNWHKPIMDIENREVVLGKEPFIHNFYHPRLMTIMRKNLDRQALYVPKLAFVKSLNNIPLHDLQFCKQRLENFSSFIEFDLYLVFPLCNSTLNSLVLDLRGNRGRIHMSGVTIEHLYYFIDKENYNMRVNILKSVADTNLGGGQTYATT